MRAETGAALATVDTALKLMRRRVGADRITSKGGRDLMTAGPGICGDVLALIAETTG
jgi:hypothetical protein